MAGKILNEFRQGHTCVFSEAIRAPVRKGVSSVSDGEVGRDDGHAVTGWLLAGISIQRDHPKACSHPSSPPSQYRLVSESVVWPEHGRYASEIKEEQYFPDPHSSLSWAHNNLILYWFSESLSGYLKSAQLAKLSNICGLTGSALPWSTSGSG